MHRQSPLTARLRRSRYAGWLAVCLLFLQVVGAAEHVSAQAAAAGSTNRNGPLGFLSICTARGVTAVPVDGMYEARPDSLAKVCALCAMDAMAGQAVLANVAELLPPPSVDLENAPGVEAQAIPAWELRYGAVRGPPVLPS